MFFQTDCKSIFLSFFKIIQKFLFISQIFLKSHFILKQKLLLFFFLIQNVLLFFIFLWNFYWSIVDLQHWVSFCCKAKWLRHTYAYIFNILFYYGLPQNIEWSSLFYPSNEHPGLISFRMDWLDLLAVQGTLKSLLQRHSSKASILRHSAFFFFFLFSSSIPGSGRSPGEGMGYPLQYSWASLVTQTVKNLPAMQETWVWPLGWEDPAEEGMTIPLQYYCLEKSMDRGAWRATVHGVTESRTQLSDKAQHSTESEASKGKKGQNSWWVEWISC